MSRVYVTIWLGLALLTAAWAAPASAQSLAQWWSEGNSAYFQGDYAKAVARYQALVDAGVEDADVYYNLGTAYARLGQCGLAIVAFERSLRLSAGDAAAETNLRACQAQLGKRRAQRDGEATVQTRPPWSEALVRPVSADALAWLVLVLNVACFGALLLRRVTTRDTLRLALAVAAALLGLGLGLATLALATKREWLRDGTPAIVLREDAALLEGPDPRAKSRALAMEGEPARILQGEGEFVRVRLARGPEGWLARRDVGAI